MVLAVVGVALASSWVRESRPAMGTVVGVTLRVRRDSEATPAAFARVFETIERWEAALSEWRPGSLTSRLNTGESVTLPPEADDLFARSEALRIRSGGAFSLTWRGGELLRSGGGAWAVRGGVVGLGAVLKGFLVDRAAAALRPWPDFLIDAAGDVYASGNAGDGRPGWSVSIVGAAGAELASVRLRDEALSTSGDDQQPGHIRDARTGEAVNCVRTVSVIAPTAEEADGLATAVFATCGRMTPPAGVKVLTVPVAEPPGRRVRFRSGG